MRFFLSAFTPMAKGDPPYINASLYEPDRVQIIMRNAKDGSQFSGQCAQIDMTRQQFLEFCRDAITALKHHGD
jgi:hypothetical protein